MDTLHSNISCSDLRSARKSSIFQDFGPGSKNLQNCPNQHKPPSLSLEDTDRPLPDTPSFTAYSQTSSFGDEDQGVLARFFSDMHARGARLMLSNSDPHVTDDDDDFFDDLYSDFNITRVNAIRAINSDGGGRGAITEILVTNYEA